MTTLDRVLLELERCAMALPDDSPRRHSAIDLIAEIRTNETKGVTLVRNEKGAYTTERIPHLDN